MNKHIIFFLLIIFGYSIFCAENEKQKAVKEVLVKRTIVIMPFLNKNKVDKFGYISETLRDVLKAKIIETKIFNLISFSDTDEKIKHSGFNNETVLEEVNAKAIAQKLKADLVIIGKYVIIENTIMIQLNAIDVFTGVTAISIIVNGDTGLDLFKLIDESTVNMTNELTKKFQEVKKSYFTEMTKVIQNERLMNFFTPRVRAGFVLSISGTVLVITGITLLIYHFAVYNYVPMDYFDVDPDEINTANYNRYVSAQNLNIALFCLGVIGISLGVILTSIGIPFIVYKKKVNDKELYFKLYSLLKFEISLKM